MELLQALYEGLRGIPGVRPYGPAQAERRVSVLSMTLEGYDPQELAGILDSAYGIKARAGLHCAPRRHQALGTLAHGGTLRFSVGVFNTAEDIDTAIRAIREIAG
jgi:selenocysteine lyase/cysteine desulfurase